MKHIHTSLMFSLVLLFSGCRPASQDNMLYDSSTDQVQIKVTEQSKRLSLRGPNDQKIVGLKELATAKDSSGSFTPAASEKYVALFITDEKLTYSVDLDMGTGTNCKTVAPSGVPLYNGATFNVSCVSETALTTQLKASCKELASDAAIADYDESKDYCTCLKRTDRSLYYKNYFGKASQFKLDCKNTATREQLKSICTEIRDRQCPTCVVDSLSCECPKKVTLNYDSYLSNIEKFRSECQLPAGEDVKPVQSGLTAEQMNQKFEDDCHTASGTITVSGSSTACKCKTNTVGIDEWKKDTNSLNKACKSASATPAANQETLESFGKACKDGNGNFYEDMAVKDESYCSCKKADGTTQKLSFKDFKTAGIKTFADQCIVSAPPAKE